MTSVAVACVWVVACRLACGARVRVAAECALGGARPSYTFETWVQEVATGAWAAAGPPLSYPEAALNVNDAMDVLMEQMAP